MEKILYIIVGFILSTSCIKGPEKNETIPILGAEMVFDEEGNQDTIYKQIDSFSFIDQDSNYVSEADVAGKIYVVDFFFTSCPTICPKMTKQMLRVYEEFEGNNKVEFISHSIDTRHDSVPVLKAYASKLGINSKQWHFVTGSREDIYNIAEVYMVSAMEDESAPGGYIHSGAFILMDGQHRIRGYYDGILPEDVDQMMLDIETLLNKQ